MEVEGVVEVCVEEVNDDDIDAELAKLMEDSESTDNVETPQQPDPTHVRQKSMAPPQMCADSIELMDQTMESEMHKKRQSEAFMQSLKDEIGLDQIYKDAYTNDESKTANKVWELDQFFKVETESSESEGDEIIPEVEFHLSTMQEP